MASRLHIKISTFIIVQSIRLKPTVGQVMLATVYNSNVLNSLICIVRYSYNGAYKLWLTTFPGNYRFNDLVYVLKIKLYYALYFTKLFPDF